jgi:hypothetical protein
VTTQIAEGVGLLIDTNKFGRLLVREPLGIRMGTANDDFTRNLVRFVCEERMVLAVERPTAVCSITGLRDMSKTLADDRHVRQVERGMPRSSHGAALP